MRAIRLRHPGGIDHLYLDSSEAKAPARGEVTVRVRASSLNYHDLLVVKGILPVADARIPLSDGAGDIVALGPDVTGFAIGDRVMSTFFRDCRDGEPRAEHHETTSGDTIDGFARESITVPIGGITLVPRGYTAMEAATLPCAALTAWRALIVNGKLKPGDSVLVQGTGGVSIFALQFAKAAGATVIGTSSSSEKLEVLKSLGADDTVNYLEFPEWGKQVRRSTNGRGVDHIVEVGGAGTLSQSIIACAEGGHIAMIGVLAGYKGEVSTAAIMGRQLRIRGITVGSRAHQIDMVRAIDSTGIRPLIDRDFALEDLGAAFRYQESGQHVGKIGVAI